MYTYQDFIEETQEGNIRSAIYTAITKHKTNQMVSIAYDADRYDRQRNTTINAFTQKLFSGNKGTTSSSNKLSSSFFRRLNTQRMTYSLGNGVTFNIDGLKERLGVDFDTKLRTAGYYALIHGLSFMFWNVDRVHVFKITEFVPLWDEYTGELRAGIRYWQIDKDKPLLAVLYEEDGFSKYSSKDGSAQELKEIEEKRSYRMQLLQTAADEEPEVVGEDNYSRLPIVPLYGSRLQQSTLVGMKNLIDAYDLVRSGFANDMADCSQIYWIVNNAGGMDDEDLDKFRNRLLIEHIANVEDADEVSVTPYTQEVPFNARQAFLNEIRSGIYEDFGGLDVHTIAAGATNDHIDAAYQPMDENADDFEFELIQAIQALLEVIGEVDTPSFKRNRISNQKEQTDMIIECANWLDDETILKKLPFITPDEIKAILEKKDVEELEQFNGEE